MRYMKFNEQGNIDRMVEFADAQLATLRISDPVLTTIAQGYTNQQYVARTLFPTVQTTKRTGKFPAFGKEAFKIYRTKRALSGTVAKMEVQSGSITMSLEDHSLGFLIDDAELEEFAGSPEQLRTIRQQMVSEALALEEEDDAAALAVTSGNYPTGNKSQPTGWGSSTVDPVTDFETAKEAILKAVGRLPNVCIFSQGAWKLFKNNTKIIDRIKYGGLSASYKGYVSEAAAADLLEIPTVVVARAVKGTGVGGGVGQSALTMSFVWDQVQANNVVLAWVGSGWGVPSFGYTYERAGYPQVESYRMEWLRSQAYDETRVYDAAITLSSAGYLMYGIA